MLDLAKDYFILSALAFTSLILNCKATRKLKKADEISSTPNSCSELKKVALKFREMEKKKTKKHQINPTAHTAPLWHRFLWHLTAALKDSSTHMCETLWFALWG